MSTYDPSFKPAKNYALIGQKVVIFNQDDTILLLQRSEKSGAGGKWSLVGGGLDHGEDSIAGIEREVQEELQIEVVELKPFWVKTYLDKKDFIVIIAYEAEYQDGQIILNWEHTDYRWVSKNEALKMDLTPDARDIIKHWRS